MKDLANRIVKRTIDGNSKMGSNVGNRYLPYEKF